uniref:Uncharacterized protein n=1 Tax=Anguilla anguilla TaxID=7936 RepID=A0A0E9SPP8_ANGAN
MKQSGHSPLFSTMQNISTRTSNVSGRIYTKKHNADRRNA